MNEQKKVVNGMSEQNTPNPQDQQNLTMPWIVLSNQIQNMDRNLNQRLDDFKSAVNTRFDVVEKRLDGVDSRLANRMNIWLAVILMIFSVLLGFLLGHVSL